MSEKSCSLHKQNKKKISSPLTNRHSVILPSVISTFSDEKQSFALFARAFFIFVNFAVVLVISTT